MKLKELIITKTKKTQDPTSTDRFSRVEVGITKTYSDVKDYPIEKIKKEIDRELSILLDPDDTWIRGEDAGKDKEVA